MQSDKQLYPGGIVGLPCENHLGFSILHDNPLGAAADLFLSQEQLLRPIDGIELQPSSNCPKNFVFDQTLERSQIMFHPAIAPKFTHSGFNPYATSRGYNNSCIEESNKSQGETEMSSLFIEDLNDIDVLLSLDYNDDEPEEQGDLEEVSTARTNGHDGRCCPDSCCNNYGGSKAGNTKKICPSHRKLCSGGGSSGCSESKRKKMKTMVSLLRGIVPGGQRMNTVVVLDEAVRYLKSLKVEVEKHGVDSLNNCA